ncbi:hypothetical protein L1787_15615 [Acuticoccus sp. M5D2P5]|uniref:hypothetical protein n=1 Tax=Acuticoccus kalidii TaxID=2910977 RepID=UPI001F3E8B15|nr:hypothetical protein [Acuticoccus kalidii]MCF3934831.1 hypothetical protein [Acuticoccus kalidii]
MPQHESPWLPIVSPFTLARDTPVMAEAKTLFGVMSTATKEIAYFVNLRISRHADLQTALSRCNSYGEAFGCVMEFGRLTSIDYLQEAERAPRILAHMPAEAMIDMDAKMRPERAPTIE